MGAGPHRDSPAAPEPRGFCQRERHSGERVDRGTVHVLRQPQRVDPGRFEQFDRRLELAWRPGRPERHPDPDLHAATLPATARQPRDRPRTGRGTPSRAVVLCATKRRTNAHNMVKFTSMTVMIAGGGIAGLTLALSLHRVGVPCHVYESAPEIGALGVGINLLPHATRLLCDLGLEDDLAREAVTTEESVFYNRFGQFIYREPLGRFAGYQWPQFSIHRGYLQRILYDAVVSRLGRERVSLGWQCTGFTDNGTDVTAEFIDPATGQPRPAQRGTVLVGCDGVHSAVRKQLYPEEGEPRYSGVNMWRGVALWEPFLTGASFVRVGWLATGKLVIYPIVNNADGTDRQLATWVVELG